MKKQIWEESERREEKRREEKKKEDQKRQRVRKSQKESERVRRKKMQMREKVGKSRNTVFFQWFVAPEGRPAKAAGAEPAGQMRDEKLHATVAQSAFRSQNVKTPHAQTSSGRSDAVSRGRRAGLCTVSKVRKKPEGFVACPKINHGRRGAFEEDLQRCIFRCRPNSREMFIRSGRWFPERGCILEHQIFRFAEMILRDRCSTSYDLAALFRGRRSTLDRWTGKNRKHIGTRPSALHSSFHVWRKSRRILFVFDVVNFEKWWRLTEQIRFWRCQVQKLRKSRRIASFSSLQID